MMNPRSNREMAAKAYNRRFSKEIKDVNFDEKVQEIVTKLLGLSKNEAHAISFVSFLIFECEKKVTGAIQAAMKTTSGKYNDELFSMAMDQLSFTQKISIYERLLKKYPKSYTDLIGGISFFRKIQNIRNDLFHSRIKDIKYDKKSLIELTVRLKMINDYLEAIGINLKKQ